ncbi:la-related protein 1C-like [Chenopodium quinoa]|nr:la-related protein 1C-like [Chenopodium quinoa]
MAATANSNPSPSLSSSSAAISPSSTRAVLPPWSGGVRRPESESTGAPKSPVETGERSFSSAPEIPAENSENGGNAGGKRPAWNKKPSNGPVENGGPGPVVMGSSAAWPTLSETKNKAPPKLSSSDSSKSLPDSGSVSSPQVIASESSSLSIAPPVQSLPQSSSASPKPTTSSLSHNSMPNHGRPARQKSMKRDSGGNSQANGGFSHQPSSAVEGSHNHNHNSSKPTSGGASDSSGRDNIQNHGHRDPGSRNASGDHPQPRNSYRRGGGGSHSRGDGSHQNYGGRRDDQDRGNHDWNHQRSFNGRDSTMQPRVSPRGFVRTQPVPPPFVHTPPMRPYMNPMGVELPLYYVPGSVPFVAPAPVYIHAAPDPQLHTKIVNQIDYYFSNENLIKDTFLRKQMDSQGWVNVGLIAGFKKVKELTENVQHILDAVRSSTVIEVQGEKIRKRDDWVRWIIPTTLQDSTASGSQSPNSPTTATLPAQFQNLKVDEKTIDQNHSKAQLDVNAATIFRSSSGDLHSPSKSVKDGASSSGC